MKVRYERGALDDLDAIFSFVAADNAAAAAHVVATIEEASKLIAANPYIGMSTSKATSGDFVSADTSLCMKSE
jgi:plasmid stabilization system protein ParE